MKLGSLNLAKPYPLNQRNPRRLKYHITDEIGFLSFVKPASSSSALAHLHLVKTTVCVKPLFACYFEMWTRGRLNHFGYRRIKFLQDEQEAAWELDGTTQVLKYTGMVKTTDGIAGMPISVVTNHITLEIKLPLHRMMNAVRLAEAMATPNPARARGPGLRFRRVDRQNVCRDDVEMGGAGPVRPGEPEEDSSGDFRGRRVNDNLPNGHI